VEVLLLLALVSKAALLNIPATVLDMAAKGLQDLPAGQIAVSIPREVAVILTDPVEATRNNTILVVVAPVELKVTKTMNQQQGVEAEDMFMVGEAVQAVLTQTLGDSREVLLPV
jgi:hypothetical protein